MGLLSSFGERELLADSDMGLLTTVAFIVVEHGL